MMWRKKILLGFKVGFLSQKIKIWRDLSNYQIPAKTTIFTKLITKIFMNFIQNHAIVFNIFIFQRASFDQSGSVG